MLVIIAHAFVCKLVWLCLSMLSGLWSFVGQCGIILEWVMHVYVCCLWSLRQKELSNITCWKGIILLSTVISARKILKHKITKLVLFKSLENTQVQNKTFCKVYSSIVACCNAAIPTLYAINNHYAIPECNAENCVNKIISRKNLVKLSL